MRILQASLGIASYQRESKNLEHLRIGKRKVYLVYFIIYPHHMFATACPAHKFLHIGKVLFHGWSKWSSGGGFAARSFGIEIPPHIGTVNIGGIFMHAVKTEFMYGI